MKKILFNKPCIGEEEIEAVKRVLKSNWIIAGEEVQTFEKKFAASVGRNYAIAVNSGTAALHLALMALKIKKGDEVIIPTYTAADLLNAVYYVGAIPVLVDNKKQDCIMDISQIPQKITKKTKAMVIPHTFGFPVDIPVLTKYHIPIIEDCAQAIGSTLNGKPVGGFGDISIFSFFATKLLTTGQGGMVATNSKTIARFVRDLISYNGRDNYIVRFNYPLTDIAASIGNVQLRKYPLFAKRRKQIAKKYQQVLEEKKIYHVPNRLHTTVVPLRFLFQCTDKKKRADIVEKFHEHNVEIRKPIGSFELLHTLLQQKKDDFLEAEAFAQNFLSLPIYPCLEDEEVERIISLLSMTL